MLAPYKFPDLTPLAEVKPRFDEVGQCLMDAAQRIRERGWTQRMICTADGAVCAGGAIWDVREENNDDPPDGTPIQKKAFHRLQQFMNGQHVPSWNDAPERTAEEVIAALESAALTRALAIRGEVG